MASNDAAGLIGLCIKAGKLKRGAYACRSALKSGKAKLLLIDGSASGNTLEDFKRLSEGKGVPVAIVPKGVLSRASGNETLKVAAVLDEGFARAITAKNIESC